MLHAGDGIAPRPSLIFTPKGDRDATFADISEYMDGYVRKSYEAKNASDRLTWIVNDTDTRMELPQVRSKEKKEKRSAKINKIKKEHNKREKKLKKKKKKIRKTSNMEKIKNQKCHT